jgi:hypothetical protein
MMQSLLLEDFIFSDYVSIIQKANNLNKVHHFHHFMAENADGERIYFLGDTYQNFHSAPIGSVLEIKGKHLLRF